MRSKESGEFWSSQDEKKESSNRATYHKGGLDIDISRKSTKGRGFKELDFTHSKFMVQVEKSAGDVRRDHVTGSPWACGGAHGPEATPTSRVTDGSSILTLLAYKVPPNFSREDLRMEACSGHHTEVESLK